MVHAHDRQVGPGRPEDGISFVLSEPESTLGAVEIWRGL